MFSVRNVKIDSKHSSAGKSPPSYGKLRRNSRDFPQFNLVNRR